MKLAILIKASNYEQFTECFETIKYIERVAPKNKTIDKNLWDTFHDSPLRVMESHSIKYSQFLHSLLDNPQRHIKIKYWDTSKPIFSMFSFSPHPTQMKVDHHVACGLQVSESRCVNKHWMKYQNSGREGL